MGGVLNVRHPDSRIPFRQTIAGHFLGYFFGFYVLMLILTLIAAYGDDAPQRQLMQRMANALVVRATERALHDADLAVLELVGSGHPAALPQESALNFLAWSGGQLGQRPVEGCVHQLKFGQQQLEYGFDPQKLARQLQQQLVDDGIQSVTLFDLKDQQLAVYPEASNGFYVFSSSRMILPLPGLGLKAELSRSARFFPQSIWRGVFMALCIGLFPFVSAWLFARRVTYPLQSLEATSRRLADGELSARAVPMRADELGRLAVTFNQMAQQLEARESELRDSNHQLQESNEFKSRFLATVSHELRTPLTAILGQTQMLLDGHRGPLEPSQQELLTKSQRNASSLLGLINDLLDLSKIEAGQMDIYCEEFDLRECVEDALTMVEPQLEAKRLKLSVSGPDQLWALGDYPRTRQILVNLLANAVKFTPQGSIQVLLEPKESQLVGVAVEDTGPGIPVELQEAIFDEFRQLDSGANRFFEGTGLGLAISRKLAVLQRGSLTVQSALGQGSKFFLTLPAASELDPVSKPNPELLA